MTRDLAKRIALAAAVIALCAGAFFACFEKREVDVWKGASAEARRNRYLALGRFLERMGHSVVMEEDFSKLDRLPDPPATVLLPLERTTFGERRTAALLGWVERGGHLVVATYTVWGPREDEEGEPIPDAEDVIIDGRPDRLLDRFGLRQRQRRRTLSEAAVEAAAPPKEGEAPAPPPQPPSVPELLKGEWNLGRPEKSLAYLEGDAEPLELQFNADFWWEDTEQVASWSVAGGAGPHLIEVAHGEGVISALTSDEPLANETLGDADHAQFVVRWLRHGRDARAPVWIFFEEQWPSLAELLRRHALPALLGAGVLLVVWLWRSLWRFGPTLPSPVPARRRWLEHLEAAGRFHWQQDRGRALLEGLRSDLLRELERKHPGWARLPERERMERLARASGLSLEQVAHALQDAVRASRSFVAAVRSLERIRAAL